MKSNGIKIILPVFLMVFLIIHTGCAQKLNNQVDYKIKYKGTNKLIDIPRATNEENAKMCLYDDIGQPNQHWKLEKAGKFFRIISSFNQKALTIQFDNTLNEWAVVQCSIGGNDDPNKQLWEIKENKNGCSIQSKFNGYKMDASGDFSQPLLKKEVVAVAWKLIPASEEELFSAEELREDIDFYIKTLEETHPNPYHKIPKDSVIKTMYATFDHAPKNKTDFAVLLAQTNHFFDGHTGHINSFNPNRITQYVNKGGTFFPEITLTNNNSAVLLQDSVGKTITLFSINGIPISQILKQMSSIYNNENMEYRQCLMQSSFMNNLILICNISSPFRIVGTNEKEKVDFVINGQTKQEVEQRTQPIAQERYKNPLRSFFYEEDAIAVLQYNTCVTERLGDMNAYMENFIAQTKEKKIKHLFIDITSNGGGTSNNSEKLVKYLKHEKLHARPFFMMGWNIDQYKKQNDGRMPSADETYSVYSVDSLNNTLTLQYGIDIPAQEDGFAGKVYLLQSRYTYSAADYLSLLVKRFGLAVIVGEPTGQPIENYIDALSFQLPNTHLWFGCALKHWKTMGIDCPTESVCPDIPIEIGCEIPSEFPIAFLKNIIAEAKK
jgi:hypothetical protein